MKNGRKRADKQQAKEKGFESCFFYKRFTSQNKAKHILKLLSALYIPFLAISLSYILLRRYDLPRIEPMFWLTIIIASIWFILGPFLVYNFMRSFSMLKDNAMLCPQLQKFLREHEPRYYRIYWRLMIVFTVLLSVIVLHALILNPQIITRNITNGSADPFYWIVLAYLVWAVIYCCNAFSMVTVIAITVVDMRKKDSIMFDPTKMEHHNTIQAFLLYINKMISFVCSGLLFVPIALYFATQKNFLSLSVNRTWVYGILFMFSGILLISITIPRMVLLSYVKQKGKAFLLQQEMRYFKQFEAELPTQRTDQLSLSKQFHNLNFYLFLQELKTINKAITGLDKYTVFTYLSSLITTLATLNEFIRNAP